MSDGGWDDPAATRAPQGVPDAFSAELASANLSWRPWHVPGHDATTEPRAARLLGKGAQGHVYSGPDSHLPRALAWKEVPRGDVAGEACLAHEAMILSFLEHPGIVTVHALARADDGTLRLGLQRIDGDTLAQRVGVATTETAKRSLLRNVLAAAEALGFAHFKGILHLDIKPENVMVGAFGETIVIDWGCARRLTDAASPGEIIGTPQAMSPEQARGEALDARADVWALGALLVSVLSGRSLFHASTGAAIVTELAAGRRPALSTRLPAVAPALVAIVDKALSVEPEDRYPDATAFAADLAAFLDGRVVGAHDYSAWELARRAVARFRLPLLIFAAVALTSLIAATVAFDNIADERDRAVAAEARATAAVARAGIATARRELVDGNRAEAELAAAMTLSRVESPIARGVVAAMAAHPRPTRESSAVIRPLGHCRDVGFGDAGAMLFCGTGEVVYGYARLPTGDFAATPTWTVHQHYQWFVAVAGGVVVHGGRNPTTAINTQGDARRSVSRCAGAWGTGLGDALITTNTSCLRWTPDVFTVDPQFVADPCGPETFVNAGLAFDDGWAVVCPNGEIVEVHDGIRTVTATALASEVQVYRILTRLDAKTYLVGTTRGQVLRVARGTGEVTAQISLEPGRIVTGLVHDPENHRVFVLMDGAGPTIIHDESLALLARLPEDERAPRIVGASRVDTVRLQEGDRGPHVVASRWLIAPGPPIMVTGLAGITAINATHPQLVGVTHTQTASILDIATGRVEAEEVWSGHDLTVAKGLVVTAESRRGGPLRALAGVASWAPSYRAPQSELGGPILGVGSYRRLLGLGNSFHTGAQLSAGLHLLDAEGLFVSEMLDVRIDGLDVRDGWLVASDPYTGNIHFMDVRGAPLALGVCEGWGATATSVATTEDGVVIFAALAGLVIALDPMTCDVLRVFMTPHDGPRRIAVSTISGGASDTWVAAGTERGEIHVWDWAGTLRASVMAHVEPVSALTFAAEGDTLYSGAWDGKLRHLDLGVLDVPRQTLVTEIERAWQ